MTEFQVVASPPPMSAGSRRRAKGWVYGLCPLVLVGGLGYVGVHLRHVHDVSWEYRWSPTAAPPRISFEGRHYLRAGTEPSLPAGEVPLGKTVGGGVIYGPPGPHEYALIGVEVLANGKVTAYSLSGGP